MTIFRVKTYNLTPKTKLQKVIDFDGFHNQGLDNDQATNKETVNSNCPYFLIKSA